MPNQTKPKGGMWMTDPYDRGQSPQRVVAIEYIRDWPVSVLTEEHWDHRGKPWFKPGKYKPTGTCPQWWDFTYVARSKTLYFHNSGGGGDLRFHVSRFVAPSPPPAKLWVAEGVPVVNNGTGYRRVSDAQLLKRGYLRIPRPLLLPKPYGGKTRNPFDAGEEGETVYCDRCRDDVAKPEYYESDCGHFRWCDGCALFVYEDTRQHVGEHEGSKCDCEEEAEDDD